jgi:hypothetical protein
MTLCVTWRDRHGLHMASDSRLTFGNVTKADIGIKLLRMPCRIYGPWRENARALLCEIEVALLLAGSHVTSTLTKESLEEVLKSLQAVPDHTRISFDKVAKICFVAYRQISQKVCEAFLGPKGIAGVHLAGFCPEQKRLRVFELSTDEKTNEHRCEEVLVQDSGFRMMGSGKAFALKHIAETGCTAFQALQHIIDTEELSYASVNPRIPAAGLIRQSSPQAKNLEVTDECDTIIAIAAAGRYSGLVGCAYEGAAGFRAKPGGLLPCAGFGSEVLYAVEAQAA